VPFRHVFGQILPLELIIGLVVFGLVLVAMAAAVIVSRRRRRSGRPPARREHWHPLEAAFGAVLAAVATFLVVESFSANAADFPHPKPAVRVDVTAFQWCWRFLRVASNFPLTLAAGTKLTCAEAASDC
jgi:cytochrome c oxidase subunit II